MSRAELRGTGFLGEKTTREEEAKGRNVREKDPTTKGTKITKGYLRETSCALG